MNEMPVNNAKSRAWQEMCGLTDLPHNELRNKYGVEIPLFNGSSSPRERRLTALGGVLILTLEDCEISASIHNDSVPTGELPKSRRFVIHGDGNDPSLVELGGNPREVQRVFADLIAWFRSGTYSQAS